LELVIRELLSARRGELVAGKTAIATGLDLGTILDGVFHHRVAGDFEALLYLWQGAEGDPLTRPLVERLAPSLHARGRTLAPTGADDATVIAFALLAGTRGELEDIARVYPDQDSALIRAILEPSAPE
jgi:hypothetical protein